MWKNNTLAFEESQKMNNDTSTVRPHDITVVGATGFTGRLVTDYLLENTPDSLRLAFAGRNAERLAALPTPVGIVTLAVDLLKESDADRVAATSHVVISTAGPYSRYGEGLVRSCARHGTHYVDLAGEVPWIRRMIDRYDAGARESGACIVPCCGFDSVPSDLGVLLLREEMHRHGAEPRIIRLAVGETEGGFSGGTVESLLTVFQEARENRETRVLLGNPDSLVTNRSGGSDMPGPAPTPDREQNSGQMEARRHGTGTIIALPRFDHFLHSWTVPFFMAVINERVVRRTNSLCGFTLGVDPDYREVIAPGPGARGFLRACALTAAAGVFAVLLALPPTRWILRRLVLPRAGEGPRAAMEGGGRFQVDLSAVAEDGKIVRVSVRADRDPGYGATAVMIAECALHLVERAVSDRPPPAGFQTPATAGGTELVRRLTAAGIIFETGE